MSKKIDLLGKENIPSDGALVIPGRLNHQETLHMEQVFSGRKVTWLCEENVVLDSSTRSYLEKDDTTAVAFSATDTAPEAIGETLKEHLQNGNVIIFLSGEVATHLGECCHIPAAIIKQLCSLGLPVLPVSVTRPKETSLDIENINRLPASFFSFAPLIPANKVSPAAWREGLLAAEELAFSSRDFLKGSLAVALLSGLKKNGSSTQLFDGTDDSATSFDKLLGAAIALSTEIKKQTKKKRVGILLPPGKGGMIANLAVLFAGKVPVNINFTSSHDAVHSSIRQAGVDKFITADPFVRKIPSFPWPPNRDLIFIERILPSIKKKIIRWVILSKIPPLQPPPRHQTYP